MSGKSLTRRTEASTRSASRSRTKWVLSLAALGATVFGAAQADAGTTVIGKSKSRGEATHEQVLENVYGGNFSQSGNDFSNGSVTITRIDDSADQSWNVNVLSAKAVAAFARKSHTLSAVDESGNINTLFKTRGKGFNATGVADASALAGAQAAAGSSNVKFSRTGEGKFSSVDSENADGRDHLVSYKVSGLGGADDTYLLFWEDTGARRSDFDYNDLVVELRAAAGEPLLIPLPAAAWTGLSGLAGLGLFGGVKRFRRRGA